MGGILSGFLESAGATTAARILFLLGSALMLGMTAFGAFGPKRLFDDAKASAAAGPKTQRLTPGADAMRLLRTAVDRIARAGSAITAIRRLESKSA